MTTRTLDEKDKYAVTGSALGAVGSAAVAIFASLHRSPSGAACSVSTGCRVRAALWVSLAVTLVAAVLPFFVP